MIDKRYGEPAWAAKIRAANVDIEDPFLDEAINNLARLVYSRLGPIGRLESKLRPSVAKRISYEDPTFDLPEPAVYEALIRSAAEETEAAKTGIGDIGRLADILVDLFASAEKGLAGIGLPLDPHFPLGILRQADAEWRLDNNRSLESVVASGVELYVIPQFQERPDLHEAATGLFISVLPTMHKDVERHLAVWTGYGQVMRK